MAYVRDVQLEGVARQTEHGGVQSGRLIPCEQVRQPVACCRAHGSDCTSDVDGVAHGVDARSAQALADTVHGS